jgi:glutathione S-transferase
MLTIYGHATSINVRKVLWTCAELGLPFEREERDTRGLNPVRMVPVIDDGGVIVWESNVIVRYLVTSRGRTGLAPAEPVARAHVEQWMDWQASDFNNSWRVPFQALVRHNPAFQDDVAIQSSIELLNSNVGIIDIQLARTRAYIAGEHFTMADIVIGLSLERWRSIPMQRPDYPNVTRYYEQLCARESFRLTRSPPACSPATPQQ